MAPALSMVPRAVILHRLRASRFVPGHREAGAAWMDDSVSVLLPRWEEMSVQDDTIVIFSTDQGLGAGVELGKGVWGRRMAATMQTRAPGRSVRTRSSDDTVFPFGH